MDGSIPSVPFRFFTHSGVVVGSKGKKPRTEPSGNIVRVSVRSTETLANGSEVVRTISGAGIIVHVSAGTSDERRDFKRSAKRLGVVLNACETAHGHFADNGQTVIVDGIPSAFEAIGTRDSLLALVEHTMVARWHYPLSVRVLRDSADDFEMTKRWACGAGPEKVRSAPKSAFGSKSQISETARTLAEATAKTVRMLSRE